MKRWLISLVLVVLIFAYFPENVNAEGYETTITVSADKTENLKAGDEITYTVKLGKVKDVMCIEFELDIPNGVTFVKGSGTVAKELIPAWGDAVATFDENPELLFTAYGADNLTTDGIVLMTFKGKVNENAGPGFNLNASVKNILLPNEDIEYYSVSVKEAEAVVKGIHEHSFVDEWSYGDEEHWNECACGEKVNISEHTYDEKGICSACGITENEAYAIKVEEERLVVSESNTEGQVDENDKENAEDKGNLIKNNENIVFWIVMGVIGVLCIILIVLIIKRIPKKEK